MPRLKFRFINVSDGALQCSCRQGEVGLPQCLLHPFGFVRRIPAPPSRSAYTLGHLSSPWPWVIRVSHARAPVWPETVHDCPSGGPGVIRYSSVRPHTTHRSHGLPDRWACSRPPPTALSRYRAFAFFCGGIPLPFAYAFSLAVGKFSRSHWVPASNPWASPFGRSRRAALSTARAAACSSCLLVIEEALVALRPVVPDAGLPPTLPFVPVHPEERRPEPLRCSLRNFCRLVFNRRHPSLPRRICLLLGCREVQPCRWVPTCPPWALPAGRSRRAAAGACGHLLAVDGAQVVFRPVVLDFGPPPNCQLVPGHPDERRCDTRTACCGDRLRRRCWRLLAPA